MLNALKRALGYSKLAQSFSGVRTIFGFGPGISDEHEALACAYGFCYARRVLRQPDAVVIVGRDPRPTGEAVARALIRGFFAATDADKSRLSVIDLGIITTPLAQTAVRSLACDGGVIVTASHNPIEHNGFKFLTGCAASDSGNAAPPGAILSSGAMGSVIEDVAALARGDSHDFERLAAAVTPDIIDSKLHADGSEASRIQAERAYLDVIGEDWGIAPHCLKPLTLGPALLDPNGGAGCGIDARVLEHFGVRVIEVNAELGYPEHGIDTDGIDPASGRHMLMRVARAAARERAHFGVAFDYDADRGNLVMPGHDETAIIPPQQVTSFNIALALARRALTGRANGKLAIVMSEATSLASERVAKAFGAEVFVVETGETNVVTKMHSLRKEGWDVPVGVEGANGGTVFESSTCRDGLQAALSAALAESQPEVAREWLRIASAANHTAFNPARPAALAELIASVPTNPNAMLRLSSHIASHAELKSRIETFFSRTIWPRLQSSFESYEFENYEGTDRVERRTGDESGGWRVVLRAGERKAFVFLRGSRTEAGIWRMIVDAADPADFALLEPAAREMFAAATE